VDGSNEIMITEGSWEIREYQDDSITPHVSDEQYRMIALITGWYITG
jgi:hypothetical protein